MNNILNNYALGSLSLYNKEKKSCRNDMNRRNTMPNPTSITEQMLYCTAPITYIQNNNKVSSATSFFFRYETTTNKVIDLLICNRHFLERVDDIAKLNFSLTTINVEIEITTHCHDDTNISSRHIVTWHLHPTEDLAFCFWNPIRDAIQKSSGKNLYNFHLNEGIIPTQTQLNNLNPLEDVVMIGYPSGLYDVVNNFPLFRKGSTSSHPAIDFNGKKQGLVDMACIPGSSGSPIFIYNEGPIPLKNGGIALGNRVLFLGIENMSPQIISPVFDISFSNGQQVIQQSINQIVKNYINLGFYIKSSQMSSFRTIIQSQLPPGDILK